MSNNQSDVLNFTASSENYGQEGAHNYQHDVARASEIWEYQHSWTREAAARKVQKAIGVIIGLNVLGIILLLGLVGENVSPDEVMSFLVVNGIITAIHAGLMCWASKSPVGAAGTCVALDGLIFVSNLLQGVIAGIIPLILMISVLCQVSKETKM